MRAVDHVELDSVAGGALAVDHELLLEVVAVVVVLAGVDVPAAELRPVDAVGGLVADEVGEVVLCDVAGAVGAQPGLVLDLVLREVVGQGGQRLVVEGGLAVGEGGVVEAPEGAELAEGGQGAVDEVLVGAGQALEDDPVEVAVGGGELDVDEGGAVVRALVGDGGGGPGDVVCRAVWEWC